MDDRTVIVKEIKKYLNQDVADEIIKQAGPGTYQKIIAQNNINILPACVQHCIKNDCSYNRYMQYEAYEIATYSIDETDEFLNTNHNRYSIVEITPGENKNIPDSCAVTNTFYIRIKSSGFQYDNSKTPLGRGDAMIFLIKNFMPAQTVIDDYFAAKKKAIALTADNSNADYCKCYTDLQKLSLEFSYVYKQLNIIIEEGELKFRTQAIANDMQNYINLLARDYVQDVQAIEAGIVKYKCR